MKSNWHTKKLRDLLKSLESGKRPKGGVGGITTGIPSLGGEHLNNKGSFEFENIRYVPNEFAYSMNRGVIRENDILIVKDGATTGKVSFVSKSFPYKKAVINEHLFLLRPSEEISPRYLYWYLWGNIGNEQILKTKSGSAQGGINTKFVDHVNIRYPEARELQSRITQKLDSLFSKIDAGEEGLQQVQQQLEAYRQSNLKKLFNKGDTAKLGDLIEDIRYGTSRKSDYGLGNIPVIRIPNINVEERTLDDADLKTSNLSENEYQKLKLHGGDVLVIRSNGSIDLVGRTAVVSEKYEGYAFAGYLIRLSINRSILLPEYLSFAMSTPFIRNQIQLKGKSTSGVNNINSQELQDLNVPIASLELQSEIVEKMNKLESIIKQVKKEIVFVNKDSSCLRQSILKKAFNGELL